MIDSLPYFKNGYYQVGHRVYSSKILALLDGSRSNIHPKWIFNNAVFDCVDWTVEPAVDIDTLYLERARDIREKHDLGFDLEFSRNKQFLNFNWNGVENKKHRRSIEYKKMFYQKFDIN